MPVTSAGGSETAGGGGGGCCCEVSQQAGSACGAPAPRETNNYYSRHHARPIDDTDCRGSCYCPPGCNCPHKEGLLGRFACPASCEPNPVMEGEGGATSTSCAYCCKRKKKVTPNNRCCCCGGECLSPPPPPVTVARCCSPVRCPKLPCCLEECPPPPPGACCGPYTPPPRKPVCYPPVQCCAAETAGGGAAASTPRERICYYPCPVAGQPKYCTCGAPNPCDCDLNETRRLRMTELAPGCRRCGRKVYAAEKIMASGGAFHTSCFSCYSCHKPLEVTNLYENQGEIYCKQCYAKYFGMSGYGYGATLLSPL